MLRIFENTPYYFCLTFLVIILSMLSTTANSQSPPALQLANSYHQNISIQDYWVSEKLDGVRAYWDGHQLISKQGHVFYPPAWFIENFPAFPLDGELWLARNTFEKLSGIVRKHKPIDSEWERVSYQIFDLPRSDKPFNERLAVLKKYFSQKELPSWLKLIEQYKVNSHEDLMVQLDRIVELGGEGLMLHLGRSYYHGARDNELLKLKRYFDAEARVISHISGKGKYKGVMGSMLVEATNKLQKSLRFKIGSGFSDAQRRSPPPIGSIITYKYFGLTNHNKPRFASFMRLRNQ